VVGGVVVVLRRAGRESTDDAFVEGHIVPVSPRVEGHVSAVHVTDNQWVREGDVLVELDPRDLQAKLEATRAAATQAEAVRRGRQVTVELVRVRTATTLTGARAGLASAEAAVREAEAEVTATQSRGEGLRAALDSAVAALGEARADVRAAVAQHEIAAADLARTRQLAEANATTQRQIDHALAGEQTAAAQLESAQGRLHTREAELARAQAAVKAAGDELVQARAQVAVRQAALEQARSAVTAAEAGPQEVAQAEAELARAEADVAEAQANARQAELDVSFTTVRAPSDGFITRKAVEPGAWVTTGQTLFALVHPDVWVVANFKETQLTDMRPGQRAEVEVDAYPDRPLRAHVDSIQRGTGARFSLLPPENATGNFVKVVQRVPVKLVLDEEPPRDRALAPGLSVEAVVFVDAAPVQTAQRSP
jgi:membrane fusion protein (multidrug efflux system)